MERKNLLKQKLKAKLQDSKEKKQQKIQNQFDKSISQLNTLEVKTCAYYNDNASNMKAAAKGYQAVLLL